MVLGISNIKISAEGISCSTWLRPKLATLWYENDAGEKWIPKRELPSKMVGFLELFGKHEPVEVLDKPPEGFIYQRSRFPERVVESVLRSVLQSEVAECSYDPMYLKRTGGRKEGIKGRECMGCKGTQVCKEEEYPGDTWPDVWEAEGSREIMTGSAGYSGELVIAMLRPSLVERARQILRFGIPAIRYKNYGQAVLYSTVACERCVNAMAYYHGLSWGYRIKSKAWKKAGTSCEICEEKPVSYPSEVTTFLRQLFSQL